MPCSTSSVAASPFRMRLCTLTSTCRSVHSKVTVMQPETKPIRAQGKAVMLSNADLYFDHSLENIPRLVRFVYRKRRVGSVPSILLAVTNAFSSTCELAKSALIAPYAPPHNCVANGRSEQRSTTAMALLRSGRRLVACFVALCLSPVSQPAVSAFGRWERERVDGTRAPDLRPRIDQQVPLGRWDMSCAVGSLFALSTALWTGCVGVFSAATAVLGARREASVAPDSVRVQYMLTDTRPSTSQRQRQCMHARTAECELRRPFDPATQLVL